MSIRLWKDGTSHHPPLPKVFKFLEMLNISLSIFEPTQRLFLTLTMLSVIYTHFSAEILSLSLFLSLNSKISFVIM